MDILNSLSESIAGLAKKRLQDVGAELRVISYGTTCEEKPQPHLSTWYLNSQLQDALPYGINLTALSVTIKEGTFKIVSNSPHDMFGPFEFEMSDPNFPDNMIDKVIIKTKTRLKERKERMTGY